jgi:hypothetical protein
MKKLLIAVAALLVLCSAATYWTNLTVNGSIIKTDPTYTGTLTIEHTANNTYTFSGDGPGTFMTAGAGNAVDFGPQALTALTRGAVFGSTTSGVYALETSTGNIHLIYGTGGYRCLVGPNITDDGSTLLQVNGGIKGTTAQFTTGATSGYVMTSDASGNGTWQPAPTSATSGSYSPTVGTITNATGVTVTLASYHVVGKIVVLSMFGAYTPTANSTATSWHLTLPSLGTINTGGVGALTGNSNSGGSGYIYGLAQYEISPADIIVNFNSAAAGAGTTGGWAFTLQYKLQ